MAATSFMRTWQDFDLIQLVVLPMFLFSATFYPIETYPRGAAGRRPAHAALPGRRPHPVADGRVHHAGPARPRRVPHGHGPHRAGRHVAAARQAAAQVARCRRPDRAAPRGARPPRSSTCRRCPRLVEWRERVAREKVARFRDETVLGPARARASATRTRGSCSSGSRRRRTAATGPGRVFTGDASGDFLFAALHRVGSRGPAGLAARRRRPDADRHVHRGGGPLRAAGQQADDRGARHLRAVPGPRARAAGPGPGRRRARGVRLGRRRSGRSRGTGTSSRPKPRFGHGAEAAVGPYRLLGTYHPSQQNTFTGVLTPPMLETVLRRAARWLTSCPPERFRKRADPRPRSGSPSRILLARMATTERDYYTVLGVERGATDAEIKRAFRKLAQQWHPDVNTDPAAQERFKEINEAYQVLSDPERRQRYDMFGRAGVGGRGEAGRRVRAGSAGSATSSTRSSAAPPAGVRAARAAADRRGPALRPADHVRGGDQRHREGDRVPGARHAARRAAAAAPSPAPTPTTCPQCNGRGEVRTVRQTMLGQMVNVSAPARAAAARARSSRRRARRATATAAPSASGRSA